MANHKLQPLNETEKKFAEDNHNLVYGFLHRYNYSIEDYYNVVIFGFLKAVQIYSRRKELQEKYDFPFIAWQYMRSEIGNNFRTENSQKRKPTEAIISLDAEYAETENLYNAVGGKSAEADVMELELINDIIKNFSEVQRKIAELKINGYSNKETYLIVGMQPSTYYKEMKRIRAIVDNLLIG